MRHLLTALVAVGILGSAVLAQVSDAPRNDLPQPYQTTRDWGQLPPGVKWAAVTAVEPSPDGTIYVIHRCVANSCAGRSEAPILKYDANGKLLKLSERAFTGGSWLTREKGKRPCCAWDSSR